MTPKIAKTLVIFLFLTDLIISIGFFLYTRTVLMIPNDKSIYRLLIDILIIYLAYIGVRWSKTWYMILLIFSGIVLIFYSVGIFVSENNKSLGLILLICSFYYLFSFFLFVYSKGINEFFESQQQKFSLKYNSNDTEIEDEK
jgi:hypothetical protein